MSLGRVVTHMAIFKIQKYLFNSFVYYFLLTHVHDVNFNFIQTRGALFHRFISVFRENRETGTYLGELKCIGPE